MEYLVPLGIIVVIAALVVVLSRWLGGAARRAAAQAGASRSGAAGGAGTSEAAVRGGQRKQPYPADTAEAARQAAARLDEDSHRGLYRLVAQGKGAEAVALYRRVTGRGPLESIRDVQALAAHPQPWPDQRSGPAQEQIPEAEQVDAEGSTEDRVMEGQLPLSEDLPQPLPPSGITLPEDLTVPEEWSAQGPAPDPAFELEIRRPTGTVNVSSDDLPPFLRDQLTAMVRDGRLEPAAEELAQHTELTQEEALQFLQIMMRRNDGAAD